MEPDVALQPHVNTPQNNASVQHTTYLSQGQCAPPDLTALGERKQLCFKMAVPPRNVCDRRGPPGS